MRTVSLLTRAAAVSSGLLRRQCARINLRLSCLAMPFGAASAGRAAASVPCACALGFALSACSGASQIPLGQNVGVFQSARSSPAVQRAIPDNVSYRRAVYVVGFLDNEVKILTNTHYRALGTITNGINGPDGETMDNQGNLYVANSSGSGDAGSITEYAPGGTSPSFTYTAGMSEPEGVGLDKHGNVYEADEDGKINEYSQGRNSLMQSCSASVPPGPIAIDSSNDVFVAENMYPHAAIVEYRGGLSGCTPLFSTLVQLSRPVASLSTRTRISSSPTIARGRWTL
jgi:hypothetical protein